MILGFWGLTVFPERTYTQIVDNSFKLSMAALDEETTPGRTSIRVSVDKKTFILCSLIAGQLEQQNLDLVFTEGEEITFSVSGKNAVHLSGNYLPEDEGMDYSEDEDTYGNMDIDGSDDDSEDEDDSEDADDLIVSRGARKLALEQFVGNEDEDEDSEEDPDFTGEDDEDEDDDLEDSDEDMEGQNNDDDEDDDDEDEDDDEEDEEDEEEEDEEEPIPAKPIPAKPIAAKPVKKEAEVKNEVKKAEVKKEVKKEEHKKSNIKTLPNGLIIEDVKVGEGARAKSGKKIGMRYIGRLTNGKVFDKNTGGKPFNFNLGRGEVIKGWDLGIQGMQLGGERKLTIPPALAYGAQGAPPDIPRNATLEFEVKLVTLK